MLAQPEIALSHTSLVATVKIRTDTASDTSWAYVARCDPESAYREGHCRTDNGGQVCVVVGLQDMSRSAKPQELLDTLFDLAFMAEREEVQVSAAVACLNRVEGKPRAQSIQLHANSLAALDDDALERALHSHKGRI